MVLLSQVFWIFHETFHDWGEVSALDQRDTAVVPFCSAVAEDNLLLLQYLDWCQPDSIVQHAGGLALAAVYSGRLRQ